MVADVFPCTIPVTVHRHEDGAEDPYGNPLHRYTKDKVMVFAVQKGGTPAVTASHPEAAEFDAVVYAPVEAGITDRDRIEVDGMVYELAAPPGNWDSNPWFSPGLVECRCKRMEG